MTVLKRKKSTQWEKAQQRINVSPIVSRISRLVPEGKAAAVGLAFGESLFFRKLLVHSVLTRGALGEVVNLTKPMIESG